MVWFVDNIEDYLWDFCDILYDLYLESKDIPIVGSTLSSLFYNAYYAMWYVAYYFGTFGGWVDDAIWELDWLSDWKDWLYDAVTGIREDIGNFLTWTQIKNNIENTYGIVTHSWSDVTGAISTAISTAISGLGDIVEHTWSDVTGAISTAISGLGDIVEHTWSDVTGAIATATDGVKTWFGEQQEMVYGWIEQKWVDKILDLIYEEVDHFKDKLWNLVEKIMEKI